ncbi:MAG: hypothetical protein E6230_14320 [Paenibacillus dendritiformis]|uniref:hypothetical protein n=1 Tax=uncultured Paenibacillus sp. TaxID=227322 RepID=UPI0025FA60E5|nr:hypothetical protein [uncultured Paenibacillus sp.]MDU5143351.1 hypothetical protein [Paenibacillus dendritiformis]
MFKKTLSLFLVTLMLGLTFNSSSILSAAERETKEETVQIVKSYIKNNVSQLNAMMSSVQYQKLKLKDIESIIDNYFSHNPAPQKLIDVNNLTIDDIFPANDTIDTTGTAPRNVLHFEELASYVANNSSGNGDSIYKFPNENGAVTVYIADTGEVMIWDLSSVPAKDSDFSNQTLAAAWKTTRTERSTGIAYNALGGKMFTIWAEGNFQYDGKTAKHNNSDGNSERHFWGSTLVLEKKAEGKERTVRVENYSYPEVYTRVYFESQFGIRWAGITMNSGTVEAYVGGTFAGNVYGGVKEI